MAAGLMVASGFAGLGYQIVWTRQCALFLGHETAAVLAVVAAFFGGLAVGALALGRRIERSARPLRWYAGSEGLIALWSGVLVLLMAPASGGLADEFAVLGSFTAGPRALVRFAGTAPTNTDDRPVVAYRAPRITYAPDSLPRERLLALLHELAVAPGEVLATPAEPGGPQRVAAYWAARNRFMKIGSAVRPTADVQRMLAQVREPLLSVLRVSPDFRPAYDPLLRMAKALASTDPGAARALLTALAQAQPARPEAAQALRGLVLP